MPLHKINDDVSGTTEEAVRKYEHVPCVSLFSSIIVRLDGHVALCVGDEYFEIFPKLTVGKNSLRQIWQSQECERIREKHLNGQRNNITRCCGCTVWAEDKFKGLVDVSGQNH
jgi:hypothetical protein